MLSSTSPALPQASLCALDTIETVNPGRALQDPGATARGSAAPPALAPSIGAGAARKPGSHSVQEVFNRAKAHPFYQDRLENTPRFDDCPPTQKDDLRPRIAEGLQSGLFKGAAVYWSPSGGSTGEVPMAQRFFPSDVRENKLMRASLAGKLHAWGMFNRDTICLNMFPNAPFYQSLSLVNDLGERAGATMLPAGGSASTNDLIDSIQAFGVNTIAGMPGQILDLTARLGQRGIKTDIRAVVTGCSKLHPGQIRKMEEDIGHPLVFTELYGSAETGVWAFKPPALSKTRDLIVDTDIAYAEVADVDEDGVGDILLTNRMRYTYPVLRYATGDRGRLHPETVAGQPVTCLEFHGRHLRSFQYSGDTVELEEFDKVLRDSVGEYQVTVWQKNGQDHVCVDVANPNPDWSADRLKAELSQEVGIDLDVRVLASQDLIRDRLSRKLKALIDLR